MHRQTLRQNQGRVVDFTNTIIIATSNLGSDIIQKNLKKRSTKDFDEAKQKSDLMDVLRHHFRPEFINRIDEIIVFHSLNRAEIRKIVELQLARVARTALNQGIELDYEENVIDHFGAVGFQPEYGARELRRLIRSQLETELARAMLGGNVEDGDRVRVRWSTDDQKVTFGKLKGTKGDAVPEHTELPTSETGSSDSDSAPPPE
jgi:ATP-dependent Clp protease ATP-binding subunit ClpC